MRLLNLPVELEWCIVVIIDADRRAQVHAKVQTIVGGKEQGRADGNCAGGDLLAVDFHHNLERPGRLRLEYKWFRLRFSLYLRQLVLRLDVCARELEQIVFIRQHAILHVAAKPAGKTAERVNHTAGVSWNLGVNCDNVRLVA